MKLTMVGLIELRGSGISPDAVLLYMTANTWASERGVRVLSCAALLALPGSPRDPKRLNRLVLECVAAELLAEAPGGYEVLERLSAAAKRMRRHRANESGPGSGTETVTRAANVHEQTANTAEGVSPTPPSVLPEVSEISGSSPALSSGSGPVSKRARRAPKTALPADFDDVIAPRVHAWAAGERYPRPWVIDRLTAMKLTCGAKGLTYADWYLAAIGWLRREDKDFGNGPDSLDAKRARSSGPAPGFVAHQQHLDESRRRPELELLRPRPEPTETVSAAEFDAVLKPRARP